MHYVGVNIRHCLLESPSPSPFSGVAHCDEEAGDYVGCVVWGGACGGALLLLDRWPSRMSETESVRKSG